MAGHDPSCGVDRLVVKALSAGLDVPDRGLEGGSPQKPDSLKVAYFSISKVIEGGFEAVQAS